LGSRHLQAIATLQGVSEITVIDPRPAALELGRQRLGEIPDINKSINFRWLTEMENKPAEADFCIIATQAKGRSQLVRDIHNKLGCRRFLIEKIVTQSVAEYEGLLEFCHKRSLSVWVNCKTRTYLLHRYIKSRMPEAESLVFSASGGNYGLGNNGVHAADLFVFYSGAGHIESRGSRIDQMLHPSKRGNDIFDLSGTLHGISENNSEFILNFAPFNQSPDTITILSKNCRFLVDHFQKTALESYAENNWQWQKINDAHVMEDWAVSHMTKAFAGDIISSGNCLLPTLKDCFPAHRFILNELLPHFNRLLGVNNDYCPVT